MRAPLKFKTNFEKIINMYTQCAHTHTQRTYCIYDAFVRFLQLGTHIDQ